MNSIYDNGSIMLGELNLVIKEVIKEIKEDTDMLFVDKHELLKELLELRDNKYIEIVCINYDKGNMGYTIDYWFYSDRVKEV